MLIYNLYLAANTHVSALTALPNDPTVGGMVFKHVVGNIAGNIVMKTVADRLGVCLPEWFVSGNPLPSPMPSQPSGFMSAKGQELGLRFVRDAVLGYF